MHTVDIAGEVKSTKWAYSRNNINIKHKQSHKHKSKTKTRHKIESSLLYLLPLSAGSTIEWGFTMCMFENGSKVATSRVEVSEPFVTSPGGIMLDSFVEII